MLTNNTDELITQISEDPTHTIFYFGIFSIIFFVIYQADKIIEDHIRILAENFNVPIIKERKTILSAPKYKIKYRGHTITFSKTPGYSISVDHKNKDKIDIDIMSTSKLDLRSKGDIDPKYVLNEETKKKIVNLPEGRIHIRSGYLQYIESDRIYRNEHWKRITERLIDIADSIK